jgi:hypothetical protein
MPTAIAPSLLFALAAVTPPSSPAVVATPAPASCVTAFYDAYKHVTQHGLPQGKDAAILRPFLSARLRRLLAAAAEYQSKYERQHPEDKPPFIEGDLFSSNFEGSTTFTVLTAKPHPPGFRVEVAFIYEDPLHTSPATKWTDAVTVISEGGRFVVDDVEYLATWPFASHGRLSENLRARD